jgi:hypothetical protein
MDSSGFFVSGPTLKFFIFTLYMCETDCGPTTLRFLPHSAIPFEQCPPTGATVVLVSLLRCAQSNSNHRSVDPTPRKQLSVSVTIKTSNSSPTGWLILSKQGEKFALALGLENKPQIFHNCKVRIFRPIQLRIDIGWLQKFLRRIADETFDFDLPLFQQESAMKNFVKKVCRHSASALHVVLFRLSNSCVGRRRVPRVFRQQPCQQ